MMCNTEIQQLVIDAVKEASVDPWVSSGYCLSDHELRVVLFRNANKTSSGLQLTYRGLALCEELFEHTTIRIANTGNIPFSTIVMNFNKYCNAPFYITTSEIKMFDKKEAFYLQLIGGDLVKYFENKKNTEEVIPI